MSIASTFIEEDGFGFVPRPDRNKHNRPLNIVRRYNAIIGACQDEHVFIVTFPLTIKFLKELL